MLKFLVDENVGQSTIRYLKEKGYDVIVAADRELSGREDRFLLEYAFKENRVIVTNDKDFGYLVYHQNLPTRGVILFRFFQEFPTLKIAALDIIISKGFSQILNHFIVVSEDKIRSRLVQIL